MRAASFMAVFKNAEACLCGSDGLAFSNVRHVAWCALLEPISLTGIGAARKHSRIFERARKLTTTHAMLLCQRPLLLLGLVLFTLSHMSDAFYALCSAAAVGARLLEPAENPKFGHISQTH